MSHEDLLSRANLPTCQSDRLVGRQVANLPTGMLGHKVLWHASTDLSENLIDIYLG